MEDWSKAHWFVVLAGIADAWLHDFEVDGQWRLHHGNPAMSSLGVFPWMDQDPPASLGDAAWIADCLAFDHDAPVGIAPSAWNPGTTFPHQPVSPLAGQEGFRWYFDDLLKAYAAAAEIRFGDSYSVRYGSDEDSVGTDFSSRFKGRESLVAMYATAARQADIMSEYLGLYRVVEAEDGDNGTTFAAAHLASLQGADFGVLRVRPMHEPDGGRNAFEVYRERALAEIQRVRSSGTEIEDPGKHVASHLYRMRNSLAHGKRDVRVLDFDSQVGDVARALPIVKLLARLAIER